MGLFKRMFSSNQDERNAILRTAIITDTPDARLLCVYKRLISDDSRYVAGVVRGDIVGLVDWWVYVETPGGVQVTRISSPHEAERPWRDLEPQLRRMISLDPDTDIIDGIRPSDHRHRLIKGLPVSGKPGLFEPQRCATHESGLFSGWGYLAPAGGQHHPWLIIGFKDRAVDVSVPSAKERERPDVALVVDSIDEAGKDLSRLDASALPMWPKDYSAALAGEPSSIEVEDVVVGRIPGARRDYAYGWGRYKTANRMAWVYAQTNHGGTVAIPMPSERHAEATFAALRNLNGSNEWHRKG
ncbi:hypothetical protein [Dactylosporangium darangshiense]|uniref:Uncharacterized protein n=1 Tax=Dactylosporangium darangshiense TaxID=579108 RepID=A0ABP8DCL3_9ACTN